MVISTLLAAFSLVLNTLSGLIVFFLALLLFFQVRNWYRYRVSGCNIPKLPETPFLGSFRNLQVHEDHLRHQEHAGNIVYSTMLHLHKVVAADADVAQIVLQKQAFPKSAIFQGLNDFWGANLLVMLHHKEEAGQQWRTERALVNPAFRLSSLRELHPIFSDIAVRFTSYLLQHHAGSGKVLDLPFEVAKVALDILSSASFSYPLGEFLPNSPMDPFLVSLQKIIDCTGNPILVTPVGGPLLQRWEAETLRQIDRVLYSVIDERIKEHQEGKKKERRHDLLDAMLQVDEEGRQLSRQAVRNELLLFYLAGHETSANTLAWTIYSLCCNPEVEQRLLDEISEVMGPRKEGQVDAPTLEQVEAMTYLEMCFQETLRLYPPVPFIPREIPETFEHNGLVYPKGAMIELSPFLIHRDPKHWPDPVRFDPERFTKENSKDRHPFSYFPFSGGPRICIGRNFFFQEAKAVLATMLRQVKFTLDYSRPNNGVLDSSSVALKPKAVWVKVEKRV